MILKGFWGSIQTRLTLSFLLSAIIAVILVVIFGQWLRVNLLEQADAVLLSKASNAANRIEEFHRSNLQAFSTATRFPALIEYILASEEERQDPELLAETRLYLGTLRIEPWSQFYALSFGLYDLEGNNILDTVVSNIGQSISDRQYFREAVLTGVSSITDIFYLPQRSGSYFYYLIPIRRAEAPNEVIGLLQVELSIGTLQDIVNRVDDDEELRDIEFSLYDSHLVRLADTDPAQSLFRTINTYSLQEIQALQASGELPSVPANRISQSLPILANAIINNVEDAVVTSPRHLDGQDYRIAAEKIITDNFTWTVTVAQPFDSFYLPIQQQTQGIILLSVMFLTGALISSTLIARSVIVPIQHLIDTVEAFGHGSLEERVKVTSSDEVGRLGSAFNEMAQEVQDSRENLESLVSERTESLVLSNEALVREIAERKRLQQQTIDMAIESERGKILAGFIQDSSHEFRTPLSLINVKVHLLKRKVDESLLAYLDNIQEQSKQIETIVNTMVLMSRLDTTSEIITERVFLDDFLKSIFQLFSHRFDEKNISLRLDLHADSAAIEVNTGMLRDALERVLDNALRFTASGGIVSIYSEVANSKAEIRIQDTGEGMSPEVLERAFERFYRGDVAHTTRGIGLGLPIAKRIMDLLKGEITLESSSLGGTVVILHLPLANIAESEESQSSQ